MNCPPSNLLIAISYIIIIAACLTLTYMIQEKITLKNIIEF